MLKELYNAIATRLNAIRSNGSPVFKQIELWNNQWAYEKELTPLQFPCAFIEFVQLPMEQVSQHMQQSTSVIKIHIGSKTQTENPFGRTGHDKYNEHLDLVDVVAYWLSGFSGPFFGTFRRTAIEVDHNHDQLVAHVVTYNTRVNDTSAVRQRVKVTGDIIQIEPQVDPAPLYIGKYYQGGRIFSLDRNGTHGLICAPHDISTGAPWAPEGDDIETGAQDYSIGAGASNTEKIVDIHGDEASYAAKLCKAYRGEGYSDWYLPSIYELEAMFMNIHARGQGKFATAAYWSSTESDVPDQQANSALDYCFGDQPEDALEGEFKNALLHVRPVRSF